MKVFFFLLLDCRRAAHFAHFNADEEADATKGENVHVGGEEVSTQSVSTEQSVDQDPWSLIKAIK
jgi:hypothetical protein